MSRYKILVGIILMTFLGFTAYAAGGSSGSGASGSSSSSGSSSMPDMGAGSSSGTGSSNASPDMGTGSSGSMGSGSGMSSNKVDINSASVDELKSLPGISNALAQNIVDYRNSNGPFKSVSELKNVKGMTSSKFNRIKDSVTIGSSSSKPSGSSSMPGSSPDTTTTPSGPPSSY